MEVKQCAALIALEARISPNLQGITSFKIQWPFLNSNLVYKKG